MKNKLRQTVLTSDAYERKRINISNIKRLKRH